MNSNNNDINPEQCYLNFYKKERSIFNTSPYTFNPCLSNYWDYMNKQNNNRIEILINGKEYIVDAINISPENVYTVRGKYYGSSTCLGNIEYDLESNESIIDGVVYNPITDLYSRLNLKIIEFVNDIPEELLCIDLQFDTLLNQSFEIPEILEVGTFGSANKPILIETPKITLVIAFRHLDRFDNQDQIYAFKFMKKI
jgi:hypothetical protein